MAQKVLYVLTDDLDQSEAAETLSFGIDSNSYEIDLSSKNAQALRDLLAPYVAAGRRVSSKRIQPVPVPKRRSAAGVSATDVRAWAQSQGLNVSARGRVPAEIREAYERAHH